MSDEDLLPTTSTLADGIPRELIYELAKGLEDPARVASRHGIDPVRWQVLSAWPPLQAAIEKARAQLDAEGLTFKYDAKAKAEVLSDKLFKRAVHDEATPGQILAALEYYTAIADLKPKQVATVGAGNGFSLQIVLNQEPVKAAPVTIDAPAVEKSDG